MPGFLMLIDSKELLFHDLFFTRCYIFLDLETILLNELKFEIQILKLQSFKAASITLVWNTESGVARVIL